MLFPACGVGRAATPTLLASRRHGPDVPVNRRGFLAVEGVLMGLMSFLVSPHAVAFAVLMGVIVKVGKIDEQRRHK